MFPFASALLLQGGSVAVLDAQTVLSGARGSVIDSDRLRGFEQSTVIGSISDGTSNVYSGSAITALHWFENYGSAIYALDIPGAANSGWTTLTIGSTVLLRTSAATFAAGRWEWTTTDTISGQAFGGDGSSHPCVFT